MWEGEVYQEKNSIEDGLLLQEEWLDVIDRVEMERQGREKRENKTELRRDY